MLTAILLLLSISQSSPAPQSCPRIEYPSLPAPRVEGMPEPLPVRDCAPTKNVAALMYSLGIDAAEPVEVTELDADIYEEDGQ